MIRTYFSSNSIVYVIPAMARRENIAVPPVGKVFEEILMVPGHMIPTENPHAIQPISPMIGLDDKAVSR